MMMIGEFSDLYNCDIGLEDKISAILLLSIFIWTKSSIQEDYFFLSRHSYPLQAVVVPQSVKSICSIPLTLM